MNFVKRISIVILSILMFVGLSVNTFALTIKEPSIELNCKSAVLMDANTGTILYEKNSDIRLSPASVTKIMTLLLVFEAIDGNVLKLEDELTVSEYAASMGGSQIFLEPGEVMTVEDLIKSVVVASANDAAVTLAEHISGSEEAFVDNMNKKAAELGMNNTNFENVTGLDDDTTDHLTTAKDIAIMSRELLKHEKITDYTTIWMDTVRNGEFGLTNTNRLVRFYRGITGLKTGSTSKAGFCISATAKRENTHLIAVIMGAESSDARNASVAKLLDFGFANYSICKIDDIQTNDVKVYGAKEQYIETDYDKIDILINKGNDSKIQYKVEMNDFVTAPIKKGDVVGKIIFSMDGETIAESNIFSLKNVEKITFWEYVSIVTKKFLLK